MQLWDTEESAVDGGRACAQIPTAQEDQEQAAATGAYKSARPFELQREPVLQHPDFTLLTSRNMREQVFTVPAGLSHWAWCNFYGGPREVI